MAPEKQKLMIAVAGNDINLAYGVELLRTGAANNRHAAAAMVFARLVGSALSTPTKTITSEDWRAASRQAIINAGAGETASILLVEQMVEIGKL